MEGSEKMREPRLLWTNGGKGYEGATGGCLVKDVFKCSMS